MHLGSPPRSPITPAYAATPQATLRPPGKSLYRLSIGVSRFIALPVEHRCQQNPKSVPVEHRCQQNPKPVPVEHRWQR